MSRPDEMTDGEKSCGWIHALYMEKNKDNSTAEAVRVEANLPGMSAVFAHSFCNGKRLPRNCLMFKMNAKNSEYKYIT